MNTHTYESINACLVGRNANRRKLNPHTYAERRDNGAIAVKFWETDILLWRPDGSCVVNTGGFHTVTTKDRLNQFLPLGVGIFQRNGIWFWSAKDQTAGAFTDGDCVLPDGTIQMQNPDTKDRTVLRNRIRKYAALYSNLPLPEPSGADCWHCHFTTQEGKSLGDSIKDTGHLESHMEEGCVVPSLAFHAMKERGCGPIHFAAVFGHATLFLDVVKRDLPRWVRRYLYRRFNQAA